MDAKLGKFKLGLRANYTAHVIAAELDEKVPRNLDYLIAINTQTAYLLLVINKPQEALDFILAAQRCCYKLAEDQKFEGKKVQGDSSVQENDIFSAAASEKTMPLIGKISLFNPTILTNYILSLCLMKNLAIKFIEPSNFD